MEHLSCFFKILPSSMNNKQSLSRGPLPHPCLSSPCPCASCSQRPRFLHPQRPLSPVLLTVLLTGRCQVSSQGTLVHNSVLQSWSLDKTKRGGCVQSAGLTGTVHLTTMRTHTHTNEPCCPTNIQAVFPNLQSPHLLSPNTPLFPAP